MLSLVEPINKEKSSYIDIFNIKDLAFDRKDPNNINKATKILNRSTDTKMPDIKQIPLESKYNLFN